MAPSPWRPLQLLQLLLVVAAATAVGVARAAVKVCSHANVSCSAAYFGEGVDPQACQLQYYTLNGAECAELAFDTASADDRSYDFGTVDLKPFVELDQIMFNLTFADIKWTQLSVQMYQNGAREAKNFCRTFRLWPNLTVAPETVFSYACPWSESDYHGKVFRWHLSATNGRQSATRSYLFRVPTPSSFEADSSNEAEVFLYVETTDPNRLRLHIESADKFRNNSEYYVTVYRARSRGPELIDVRVVDASATNTLQYDTFGDYGKYHFNVSRKSAQCLDWTTPGCLQTSSPVIVIARDSTHSLVIGIVSATAIIPLALLGFYMWRRHSRSAPTQNGGKILLAYAPSTVAHVKAIECLARLLAERVGAPVLLDVADIPRSESRDPFRWYLEAFNDASHVVFVASPTPANSTLATPYRDGDSVALRLIREEVRHRRASRKRLLGVSLPYAAELPAEMGRCPSYRLPEEAGRLVRRLRRELLYEPGLVGGARFWAAGEGWVGQGPGDELNELERAVREAGQENEDQMALMAMPEVQFGNLQLKLIDDDASAAPNGEGDPLIGSRMSFENFNFDLQTVDLLGRRHSNSNMAEAEAPPITTKETAAAAVRKDTF